MLNLNLEKIGKRGFYATVRGTVSVNNEIFKLESNLF